MRLRRMDLRHFRVHQNTSIDFESGLTAIVGQNESGKSSVLEALTWALYGGPAVRGAVKGIRWRNAPSRQTAKVEVIMTLGDTDYLVTRTETTAKVHSRRGDDEWMQVADGSSGVTEYMTDRMGMTLPEFSSTYLCNQKDVSRLAAMKPMERQTFIRRIMGGEKTDAAVKTARKAARDASNRLAGVESTLGDGAELELAVSNKEEEAELTAAELEKLRAQMNEAEKTLKEHRAEERQHDEMKQKHAAATERLDNVRSWIRTRQRSRAEFVEMRTAAEAEVELHDQLEKELEGFDSIEFLLGSLDEAAKIIEDVKRQRASLDQVNRRLEGIEKRITEDEAIVAGYDPNVLEAAASKVEELRDLRRRLHSERLEVCAKLQSRIDEAEKMRDGMSKALGSGICPTCAQPLKSLEEVEATQAAAKKEILAADAELAVAKMATDEERQAIIDSRAAEEEAHKASMGEVRANDARNRLERNNHELAAAVDERTMIQRRIDSAESQGAVRDYDAEQHRRVREKHRAMEQKYHRRHALRNAQVNLDRANQRIAHLEAQLGEHAVEQIAAESALEAISYDPERHEALIETKTEAHKEFWRHQRAVQSGERELALTDRELAVAKQQLADHRAREEMAKDLRRELRFQFQVRDWLQDFRGTVLDTVKPDIAEVLSGMLEHLTDGRHESVAVDDTFGVVLYEGGMESPVVSGGTEDVAALALRIALSQLVSERSGQPLSLLILDEPFGSLDDTRRAAVLRLLTELRDVFAQVVMISHVEETREAADHTIELSYDPSRGCSRVA